MKNLLNTEVVAGFVTSCRRCDFPLHIVAPCVAKGATMCNDLQRVMLVLHGLHGGYA